MKVLTAAQMREIDRKTIESGIPGIVLMENAGSRVVDFLAEKFAPLEMQRIVVLCGKGNNGGDGLVIARQLHTRFKLRALYVVLAGSAQEMKGDAAANLRMLLASGGVYGTELTAEMHVATVVVDALLGTGLHGPAEGSVLGWIEAINQGFPLAQIVAVDVPSGMQSDTGNVQGVMVTADYTVTLTAPKVCQVLSPAAERCGKLRVAPIGTPPDLFEKDASLNLSLTQPEMFRHLFEPRELDSNKGRYGHVLVLAGARGKTGAAAMSGMSALRAGAGLVTIGSADDAIEPIAAYAPELMTAPLARTDAGSISTHAFDDGALLKLAESKTVVALGPGLGSHPDTVRFVERALDQLHLPMVLDADGLNAMAGKHIPTPAPRILTPHPGEMGRLASRSVHDVQADRVGVARWFAREHGVVLVLKGHRTVIAFPDGRAFVNPTNSPALATGGTGDVLTGLIAGLLAQFPDQLEEAVLAAVYLHGRCGVLGAEEAGDKTFVATDIFKYLPAAMREVAEGHNPTLV